MDYKMEMILLKMAKDFVRKYREVGLKHLSLQSRISKNNC